MTPLFFMWIPKTGGTTLHNAFLQVFKKRHIGESWTQNPGLKGIDLDDGSDYYVGHWPACVRSEMGKHVAVTMLRDPIDRLISQYNHLHEHGYHYDDEMTRFIKQATFDEWLDSQYAIRAANNLQTRFFCDREEDNLDRALEAMAQFDAVGILADPFIGHQYIMEIATERCSVPTVAVNGWAQPSTKHMTRDQLASEQRAHLVDRNQHDYCLIREAIRMGIG